MLTPGGFQVTSGNTWARGPRCVSGFYTSEILFKLIQYSHWYNIKFRGRAVLSLLFPLGGFRSWGWGANQQVERKKEDTSSLRLCWSFHTYAAAGCSVIFGSYFPKQNLLKTIHTTCGTIVPRRRRVLPFWCNIWRPGTEGNPIILCRGARPTLPPRLWSDDLAG